MNRMWEYRPLLTVLLSSRVELKEQVEARKHAAMSTNQWYSFQRT